MRNKMGLRGWRLSPFGAWCGLLFVVACRAPTPADDLSADVSPDAGVEVAADAGRTPGSCGSFAATDQGPCWICSEERACVEKQTCWDLLACRGLAGCVATCDQFYLGETCVDRCKAQYPAGAAAFDTLMLAVNTRCAAECPGTITRKAASVSGWATCTCGSGSDSWLSPVAWSDATGKCDAATCHDGVTLTLQVTVRTPDFQKHRWWLRDVTAHREVISGSGGGTRVQNDLWRLDLRFPGRIEPGHAYDFFSVTWDSFQGACLPSTPIARASLGVLTGPASLTLDASNNTLGACTFSDLW